MFVGFKKREEFYWNYFSIQPIVQNCYLTAHKEQWLLVQAGCTHLNAHHKTPDAVCNFLQLFIWLLKQAPCPCEAEALLSQHPSPAACYSCTPERSAAPQPRRIPLPNPGTSPCPSKLKPSSYLHLLALLFVCAHWTSPIAGSLPRWHYRNLLEWHSYRAAGCQYLFGCLISSLPPSSPPV